MSKITVTTIAGQTSGSDANKVKIESGDTLEVTSNATVGGTLGVTGDATFDTNTLKVDSSNNRVGIGTASPLSELHQDIGLNDREGHHLYYGTDAKAAFTVLPNTGEIRIGAATTGTSGNYNTEIMSRNGGNLVTSIKADAYGRVTEPSQPSFLAKGANNAYITTSPIPFPTVSGGGINAGAHNIGGHYNTSNYTFTAPIAGRYFFYVHIGIVRGGSATAQMYPTLLVNGTGVAYSYAKIEVSPTANHYLNCSISQILSLAANDAVKVNFSQSGTGSYYNGPSESSFMGYLLG